MLSKSDRRPSSHRGSNKDRRVFHHHGNCNIGNPHASTDSFDFMPEFGSVSDSDDDDDMSWAQEVLGEGGMAITAEDLDKGTGSSPIRFVAPSAMMKRGEALNCDTDTDRRSAHRDQRTRAKELGLDLLEKGVVRESKNINNMSSEFLFADTLEDSPRHVSGKLDIQEMAMVRAGNKAREVRKGKRPPKEQQSSSLPMTTINIPISPENKGPKDHLGSPKKNNRANKSDDPELKKRI